MTVIGRFAPSPTGPLHFGSVLAAVASYMQAKSQHGKWLLRIDNIDPPREQSGADVSILKTLEALGLHWDGEVLYQSHRHKAYQEVLDYFSSQNFIYRCTCTRKQLKGSAYPGTCRSKEISSDLQHALRIITNKKIISFDDGIQGSIKQNLETEIGDFIVRRADDLIAYHVAVVVDDAWQGVSEIVRGADLLDSTPRQIYLQELLNYPTPVYTHLPVAVNREGYKLSKQYHASPVDDSDPVTTLISALEFLGQDPEKSLAQASVEEIIHWGTKHWSLAKIPRLDSIEVEKS